MTKLEALIQLRDAVRAGREPEWDDVDDAMRNQWSRCLMAYRGSLDAAKALHEAVLPGWCVEDLSQNGRMAGHPWGVSLARWSGSKPQDNRRVTAGWGYDDLPSEAPARAWLLAILDALIAEAKTDE